MKELWHEINTIDQFYGEKPKTSAGVRDVPLTDHLKQIFKSNLNFKFLFTKPDGSFIATSTINSHFKRICKDAHIREYMYERTTNGNKVRYRSSKVTTHMLRHTFRNEMHRRGYEL